jgi:hypothetical protein
MKKRSRGGINYYDDNYIQRLLAALETLEQEEQEQPSEY